MGRASRKGTHWTEEHPDRHRWLPHHAAIAKGMSQAAYEAVYGRTSDRIDFLADRPNRETREAASKAIRSFSKGNPGDLLSIVRTCGEPEWGSGSFLEKTYQRAFAIEAKSFLKSNYSQKLLQKDPAMDALFQMSAPSFYKQLRHRSLALIGPESSPLSQDWIGVVLATPDSELRDRIAEEFRVQPISRARREWAQAFLKDGSSSELEEALRREVSSAIESALATSGVWDPTDRKEIAGFGARDPQIQILRYTNNPLLHLRDPARAYGTLCGKSGGYQGTRGSWRSGRHCRQCEAALQSGTSSEIQKLQAHLFEKDDVLPLPDLSTEERRAFYESTLSSPQVVSALKEMSKEQDSDSYKKARERLRAAISEQTIDLLLRLDQLRQEKVDKASTEDEDNADFVQKKWGPWRSLLRAHRRSRLQDSEFWDDEEALSEIFSPEHRRAILVLAARRSQARSEGSYQKARKIDKALVHIVHRAADLYLDSRETERENPTQTEALQSQ